MLSLLDKSTRHLLGNCSLFSHDCAVRDGGSESASVSQPSNGNSRLTMEVVHSSSGQPSPPSGMAAGLTCVMCNVCFESRQAQVEHVRLDWHRFNLRQQLAGRPPVAEDVFDELALLDGVSSISGSDAEPPSDEEDLAPQSTRKPVVSAPELDEEGDESSMPGYRAGNKVMVQVNGSVYSLYRILVNPPKITYSPSQLQSAVNKFLAAPCKCIIVMLSAGHFAGAVFDGESVVVHKTFHRYVVRAKGGTAQSVHDSQGHHAKSAGANLRRYNEEALKAEIIALFQEWSEHVKDAGLIFLRVPLNQRSIFFGGRTPILEKGSPRVCHVPFPTRRPTYREVQRVHTALFTLTCHGFAHEVAARKPRSISPPLQEPVLVVSSTPDGLPKSKSASPSRSPASLTRRERQRMDSPRYQQLSTDLLPADDQESHSVDDDDSESDSRDFTMSEEIVDLADRLTELEVDFGDGRPVVRGSHTPESHGNHSNHGHRKHRSSKGNKEKKVAMGAEDVELSPPDESIVFGDQLLAACRSGNVPALQALLVQSVTQPPCPTATSASASSATESAGADGADSRQEACAGDALADTSGREQPVALTEVSASCQQTPTTTDTTMASSGSASVSETSSESGLPSSAARGDQEAAAFDADAVQGSDVTRKLLNSPQGSVQQHLLVAASEAGRANVVQLLLECGADPSSRGPHEGKAYAVAADKNVRDTFRRFRGQYPDRYDYQAAAVDSALSDDLEEERQRKKAEKKKQQRQVRQKKEKVKKAEAKVEAAKDQERQDAAAEKKWLASLTDREKRALAAERRLQTQKLSDSNCCAHCKCSLADRVPFSKFDLKYCSMDCIRTHQAQMAATR